MAAKILGEIEALIRPAAPGGPAPAVDDLRVMVARFRRAAEAMARAARLDEAAASLVTRNTLRSALPAATRLAAGDTREAARALYRVWFVQAAGCATAPRLPAPPAPAAPAQIEEMVRLEPRYEIAVQADLADRAREEEGGTTLARLRAELDLSFDDLGRVLDVTGETVRRWERGLAPIPPERLAAIAEQGAALARLKAFLRAERLPVATRRKAPLFDGESARDLILRGRIAEVVERYDRALRYQA